jgi:hypothetical protein
LLSFPSPVRAPVTGGLPLLAYPHIARVANSYRPARTSPSPIVTTKGTAGERTVSWSSLSSKLSALCYEDFIRSILYLHIN